MHTANDDIYGLIAKSFVSELTEEEQLRINNWISEDPLNLDELNDFREIWIRSEAFSRPSQFNLNESLKSTYKKAGINKQKIRWISIIRQSAAILVLAVLFSSLYNLLNKPEVS